MANRNLRKMEYICDKCLTCKQCKRELINDNSYIGEHYDYYCLKNYDICGDNENCSDYEIGLSPSGNVDWRFICLRQ